MTEYREYCISVIILIALGMFLGMFLSNVGTILPGFVDYDEYWVEERQLDERITWKRVHSNSKHCPTKPWFTQKYKCIDILLESDWELCDNCFSRDLEKMIMLHYLNQQERMKYYRGDDRWKFIQEHSPDLTIYDY